VIGKDDGPTATEIKRRPRKGNNTSTPSLRAYTSPPQLPPLHQRVGRRGMFHTLGSQFGGENSVCPEQTLSERSEKGDPRISSTKQQIE